MNTFDSRPGFHWRSSGLSDAHTFLLPSIRTLLSETPSLSQPSKLFDLGCGNGSTMAYFSDLGWDVCGVDPSDSGYQLCRDKYPSLNVAKMSAYDNLSEHFGQFPLVLSLEVVEHLYDPRSYANTLFSLVQPGGYAILSTPYHSYFKNLILALSGKMDDHFTVLWDHGHIKFWSVKTLSFLLSQAGFYVERIERVGRFPALAKSMIFLVRRRI